MEILLGGSGNPLAGSIKHAPMAWAMELRGQDVVAECTAKMSAFGGKGVEAFTLPFKKDSILEIQSRKLFARMKNDLSLIGLSIGNKGKNWNTKRKSPGKGKNPA